MECRRLIWRDVVASLLALSLWKNNVLWVICIWSFHIWCQIEAIFNISKSEKSMEFWGRGKLFCVNQQRALGVLRKCPVSCRLRQYFFPRCTIKIDGVTAILKFDLSFDPVSSLFDLWPTENIGFFSQPSFISGPSLVRICQSVRELSRDKHFSPFGEQTV